MSRMIEITYQINRKNTSSRVINFISGRKPDKDLPVFKQLIEKPPVADICVAAESFIEKDAALTGYIKDENLTPYFVERLHKRDQSA